MTPRTMVCSLESDLNSELTEFLFADNGKSFTTSLNYQSLCSAVADSFIVVSSETAPGYLKKVVFTIYLNFGGQQLTLRRSFSELFEAYQALKQAVPFLLLPAFPEKDLQLKFIDDQKKVGKRAKGIETFFRKLLSNSLLTNSNILSFLEKRSEGWRPSSMSIISQLATRFQGAKTQIATSFESSELLAQSYHFFRRVVSLSKTIKQLSRNLRSQAGFRQEVALASKCLSAGLEAFGDKRSTFVRESRRGSKVEPPSLPASSLTGELEQARIEGLEELKALAREIETDLSSMTQCFDDYLNRLNSDFGEKIRFIVLNEEQRDFFGRLRQLDLPDNIKAELELQRMQLSCFLDAAEIEVAQIFKASADLWLDN